MRTAGRLFVICYRVLAVGMITLAAALLVLLAFGIHPYVVKTGSMEPEIGVGSICFVDQRTAFEDISQGDIIAFRVGDMLVTHRAVEITGEGITTQGDANNTEDAAKVTNDNYIGRTLFWIPRVGRLLLYARSGSGRIVSIGALALFILLGLVYDRTAQRLKTENGGNS